MTNLMQSNLREGSIGVLRTPEGGYIFPPVPREDLTKAKQEKIHGDPTYLKITDETLGFIGGALKTEDRHGKKSLREILLGSFLREAKKEYNLDLVNWQVKGEHQVLGVIDQIRDSREVFFIVWMFANVILYPSQIDVMKQSLIKQERMGKNEKIKVVSPAELSRFLEENNQYVRPVARHAAQKANQLEQQK